MEHVLGSLRIAVLLLSWKGVYAWGDKATHLQIAQHLQELLLSSLQYRTKGRLGIQHSRGLVVDLCSSQYITVGGVQLWTG
jgi:hypothetical protein